MMQTIIDSHKVSILINGQAQDCSHGNSISMTVV